MTGNFVGPLAFKTDDAPRYPRGFIIVLITAIVAAVLVIVYRFVCIWENKRRDKAGTAEGFDHAYEDDLTDSKVCRDCWWSCGDPLLTMRRIPNSGTLCKRGLWFEARGASRRCLALWAAVVMRSMIGWEICFFFRPDILSIMVLSMRLAIIMPCPLSQTWGLEMEQGHPNHGQGPLETFSAVPHEPSHVLRISPLFGLLAVGCRLCFPR